MTAPECSGPIYSCSHCGKQGMTAGQHSEHMPVCPKIPAATVTAVLDELHVHGVGFETVGGVDGAVRVALPGHSDRENATDLYRRAQQVILAVGWTVTRHRNHWIVGGRTTRSPVTD